MSEPAWVIEARKHIGLKEIPGPRHEPKILGWWKKIKRGGIKSDEVPWCFVGETEVMTEHGWVRFDDLMSERVYQVDDTNKLSLCEPIAKIVKEYDGDVFDIVHRSVKLTCDVGHRWWGRWGKSGAHKFGTLDQLSADGLTIPAVETLADGVKYSDSDMTLLAAFLSDGKVRYSPNGEPRDIEFEVSRERKIAALRLLGPAHEYTQQRAYGPRTKIPLTVFRFKYPAFFGEVLRGYKLLADNFVNGVSAEQARRFMAAYAMFDGNGATDGTVLIYSSSSELLNSLIMIATLAGYCPSIQARVSDLSGRPTWAIQYAPGKSGRHIKRKHVTRRHFNGTLFCVQVPHGRIVVRGPGSAPVVTGNCAAFVGGCLEEVGIISSRFESARSYMTWGVPLSQPVPGCIAVFSRSGGGHVGFVIADDGERRLLILGGNQKDQVSIAPFEKSRVMGYRWPRAVPITDRTLRVIGSTQASSTNEA